MSRTIALGHKTQPGCLTFKLQYYTESLQDTLEEFADRLCYDVTCKFQDFQKKVAQCLDLSDYVTDDVVVELSQKLVEVVCVCLYKTAQKSFRKLVLDLLDSLRKNVLFHWDGKKVMYWDETFDVGHWHYLFSKAHNLLGLLCRQAEDLYKKLETHMTEVASEARALLLNELHGFGTDNRDAIKASAADKLQTLLANTEPQLREQIGSIFLSMEEASTEMHFVALEHISQN